MIDAVGFALNKDAAAVRHGDVLDEQERKRRTGMPRFPLQQLLQPIRPNAGTVIAHGDAQDGLRRVTAHAHDNGAAAANVPKRAADQARDRPADLVAVEVDDVRDVFVNADGERDADRPGLALHDVRRQLDQQRDIDRLSMEWNRFGG